MIKHHENPYYDFLAEVYQTSKYHYLLPFHAWVAPATRFLVCWIGMIGSTRDHVTKEPDLIGHTSNHMTPRFSDEKICFI